MAPNGSRRPGPHGPLRAAALLVTSLALLGAGVGLLTQGLERRPPPPPSPAAAELLSQGAAAGSASSQAAPRPLATPGPATVEPAELAAAAPLRITIPSIGVEAPVGTVGLEPDGAIGVPRDVATTAWYRYSPSPGTLGPSVIVGHVDSAAEGPGVFYALGRLLPGEPIMVDRADGSTARFTVTGVLEVPKGAFPTAQVYRNTSRPELRLITCGGHFDTTSGHYLDNVVAFAVLDPGPGQP